MFVKRLVKLMIWGFAGVVILASIAFSSKKQSDKFINDLYIEIDNQYQNYFVDTEDVKALINNSSETYLLSTTLGRLDLKQIENRVYKNKFVSEANAYLDLHGNLVVSIKQRRPIARIFNNKGDDFYISSEGMLLPVSNKYTARVLLVSFENEKDFQLENIQQTEAGKKLMDVLKYIDSSIFWKAQIAEVSIDRQGELRLYPQVTKQEILFGLPEEIDEKFRKLMVFYQKVLPAKGWNTYQTVNLKFANQLVCE